MLTYFFERNFSINISRIFLIALATILPFLGGCSEDQNPITNDHGHKEKEILHADADGVLLKVSGVEVYRQFQESQSGEITLSVGDEVGVQVIFLNPHEKELRLDEIAGEEDHDEHQHDNDETFALAITGYDTSIIEVHLSKEGGEHEHTEDEHADGNSELSYEVIGLKTGETTIKLQLLHGSHPDFTALPIPVTVQ